MKAPEVVVVGAATRDLHEDDPRGWYLGGGVTFGALGLARLGLRIGVLLGVDAQAATAHEIDLLRDAGAEVVTVPLAQGPVFLNVETPGGRVQTCGSPSQPIPVEALPAAWRGASTWMLAPVASELPEAWATVPPRDSCVAFAWQGILRHLESGVRVTPLEPGPSALLARADIVAVSRHDLPHDLDLRRVGRWLAPESELLFTAGPLGGLLLRYVDGRIVGGRRYPGVPSRGEVDPTGAGDTMLAGLVAARIALGGSTAQDGRDLRLGAAASSLLVEGPGVGSVPGFGPVRARLRGQA
ncbi:PfkB family carbohydrate kinase [soil metagenome]